MFQSLKFILWLVTIVDVNYFFQLFKMSDYTGDFFLDPGISIKQEPIVENNSVNISASVPIPVRRPVDICDYRGLGFDLEASQSPSYQDLVQSQTHSDLVENNTMWGTRLDMDIIKSDALIHMDEDDIFQVDKADLIQGPTLAELNANDDTLLGDLNFDDLLLPEEGTYNYNSSLSLPQHTNPAQKFSTPMILQNNCNNLNNNTITSGSVQANTGFYRDNTDIMTSVDSNNFHNYISKVPPAAFSPTSGNSQCVPSTSSPLPSTLTSLQQKHSTLHELLMKRENYGASPDRTVLGKSVPGQSSPAVASTVRASRGHFSRLSSSAPTHLGLEQIWQRREPRQHLLSTGSLAEAGSTSSLSTGGVLSPEAQDFSHDELDSDEDSEHYEDFSSDNGIYIIF